MWNQQKALAPGRVLKDPERRFMGYRSCPRLFLMIYGNIDVYGNFDDVRKFIQNPDQFIDASSLRCYN